MERHACFENKVQMKSTRLLDETVYKFVITSNISTYKMCQSIKLFYHFLISFSQTHRCDWVGVGRGGEVNNALIPL